MLGVTEVVGFGFFIASRTERSRVRLRGFPGIVVMHLPITSYVRRVAVLVVLLIAVPGLAEDDSATEAKFIAMLKNATLKGTWAPVQKGALGSEKSGDSYRISRVEKIEGSKWSIYSQFSYGGQKVEFPIPATVKFAGDAAVLILDNVRTGQGSATWSARVMFHDDVYTGRWWETSNKEHGGTIAGTITRSETK